MHTSNTRVVMGEQRLTQVSFSRAKAQPMHSVALVPVHPDDEHKLEHGVQTVLLTYVPTGHTASHVRP
jgi:hypothetical protein